jgi:hypothetical protein
VGCERRGSGIAPEDQQRIFGEFQKIGVPHAEAEKARVWGWPLPNALWKATGSPDSAERGWARVDVQFAIPMEDHGGREEAERC